MSDAATTSTTVFKLGQTVDGLNPSRCVEATTLAQLQAVVRDAQNDGHAVIPVGSGARLGLGNIPTRYDVALSMSGLSEIIAYEPTDMTVTVQAGVAVADLQRLLAERGQFLPLDTCGAPGTIGGMLAANAFGSLRHRYGTARDWLIGMRVVHADGTTSKSGGRVVKNVSGYDLHKVHIGAIGTLAIIAEATFKLAPLPKEDRTLIIACPSAGAATSIISACHERGLSVVAAEVLSPTAAHAVDLGSSWTALMRIAGGVAAVARTIRDVRDLALLAEAEINDGQATAWDNWRTSLASAPLTLRISVPPSRVAETAEALDRRFAGDQVAVSCTATVGLLRVTSHPIDESRAAAILGQVKDIASARDGHVIVDAAPLAVKRTIDVFGAPRSDIAIMRRLKAEFDPAGILSPGRFLGRI